jgi:Leucine-rich repeat (LRR) protein
LSIGHNKGIILEDDSLPLNLTELNLESVGLTEFPQSLFFLEKLKILSLSRNQIKELPGDEVRFSLLEFLLKFLLF